MKSVEELKDFYYNTLSLTINELDNERESLKYRIIWVFIPMTISFLIPVYLFFDEISKTEDGLTLLVGGYAALWGLLYKFMIKDYKKDFKTDVIQSLIKEIDENFVYKQDNHISEKIFDNSDLFSSFDKFNGNDYVSGTIDGTKLSFSDLHVQKRQNFSNKNNKYKTIFQGLFIHAEFNKHFKGKTVVLPDVAQAYLGDFLGNFLQSNNMGRDELVKLDNTQFEQEFVVYSTDQIESRYILTPVMMERLLAFKRKVDSPIYFSFVDSYIHIAIYNNKDHFEPTVFTSLLDYDTAMQYIENLHLSMGIVDELKLNEKLWTKN